MAPVPALSVSDLSHSYSGTSPALEGVDLRIETGELAGLIGPNGSGKSTLLKALAGALTPSSGRVTLGGCVSGPIPRAGVAYISQEPSLDPEMTVAETFRLFAILHSLGRSDSRIRIGSLISSLGLEDVRDRLVARCSGGLRQRLHIALGFLPDSRLYLFDEPTAALDPEGRQAFWALLSERVRTGAAALVSLHDLPEAAVKCDRVLTLYAGRIRAEGSPDVLVAQQGAWVWKARLAREPADGESVRRAVAALPGVRFCRRLPMQVIAVLDGEGPADAVLAACLEKSGSPARAYERRRPDLESVFHALSIPMDADSPGARGSGGSGGNGGAGKGERRMGGGRLGAQGRAGDGPD